MPNKIEPETLIVKISFEKICMVLLLITAGTLSEAQFERKPVKRNSLH